MEDKTALTLKDAAIAEFERQNRQREQGEIDRLERERERMLNDLSDFIDKRIDPDGLASRWPDGDCIVMEVAPGTRVKITTLHSSYSHGIYRVIVGTCPRCGQEAYSYPINDLYDFGRYLSAFEVDPSTHQCPREDEPARAREAPASLSQQLEELIRKIAAEEAQKLFS